MLTFRTREIGNPPHREKASYEIPSYSSISISLCYEMRRVASSRNNLTLVFEGLVFDFSELTRIFFPFAQELDRNSRI